MYDIFDPALEGKAKPLGRTLVPVRVLTKPGNAGGEFAIAASTDRAFLKSAHLLFDLELLDPRPDNLHHRNSGLDSTLAKLCHDHDVLVGINLANLRTLDAKTMGRVMQNIALCRTHKAKMAVFSNAKRIEELANPDDIVSLLRVLGMSPKEAKDTMTNLERAYKEFLFKKTPAHVKPGVRRVA